MAEGHWERPRGLLLLSLAWLAAGQAGGREAWSLGELPAGRGRAHTASPARRPPSLYCRRARDFRCFSRWLVTEAVRWGEVGPTDEEALATGAPHWAVIVGPGGFPPGSRGGQVLHFYCNTYIKTWSIK